MSFQHPDPWGIRVFFLGHQRLMENKFMISKDFDEGEDDGKLKKSLTEIERMNRIQRMFINFTYLKPSFEYF